MTLDEILKDKQTKTSAKTETISKLILEKSLTIEEFISIAEIQKDPAKATLIEAMEFATKVNPKIADNKVLIFVTESLLAKAPRVKWESAKVIGNIAHLFPTNLENSIVNLLMNTAYDGTVVRWSAVFALGEILKLKTKHNTELLPEIENIINIEEKNSIKKIYLAALKKTKQ